MNTKSAHPLAVEIATATHEWAKKLAKALDRFCHQHHVFKSKFGIEGLGLKKTAWDHIAYGAAVSSDPHLYYILYRIGITEADPRTLPDRLHHNQKTGVQRVSRLPKDEEWEEWERNFYPPRGLAKLGIKVSGKQAVRTVPTPPPAPMPTRAVPTEVAQPNVSLASDAEREEMRVTVIIDMATLADAISARIRGDFGGFSQGAATEMPRSKTTGEDIHSLSTKLSEILKAYQEGGREQRRKLIQRHGEELGELYRALAILTLPEKEREESLLATDKFGGSNDR